MTLYFPADPGDEGTIPIATDEGMQWAKPLWVGRTIGFSARRDRKTGGFRIIALVWDDATDRYRWIRYRLSRECRAGKGRGFRPVADAPDTVAEKLISKIKTKEDPSLGSVVRKRWDRGELKQDTPRSWTVYLSPAGPRGAKGGVLIGWRANKTLGVVLNRRGNLMLIPRTHLDTRKTQGAPESIEEYHQRELKAKVVRTNTTSSIFRCLSCSGATMPWEILLSIPGVGMSHIQCLPRLQPVQLFLGLDVVRMECDWAGRMIQPGMVLPGNRYVIRCGITSHRRASAFRSDVEKWILTCDAKKAKARIRDGYQFETKYPMMVWN